MNYFEAFKQVRNRIRKYDAGAIVLGCITRLHAPDVASIERMKFQPPWLLLLLIKWAIVHGDFSSYEKKPLTEGDLNYLIRMMHEVDNAIQLPPSENLTTLRLLRPIAYQQFWLQGETFVSGFARQALLFGGLQQNHAFERAFKDETGVSISDFLELALIITVPSFKEDNHFFDEAKYFENVAHTFPVDAIPNFLKTLARSPEEVRKYLLSLEEEKKSNSSEFREMSPLVRYPLLNLGGRHYHYSRRLLTHSLEMFLYDTLRRRDPEAFMNRFGGIFQEYIHRALKFSGLKFLTEDKISKYVTDPTKLTDFLIIEPGVNVFLDAKGVEVGHLGVTSYRPEIVTDKVKASIVKGIQQGMDTVTALRRGARLPNIDLDRENNFLLLVTYKDLFLGTGKDFHESYAGDRLSAAFGNDMSNSPIPLEHVYIVSAEEFDVFIAYAVGQRDNLAEIFRNVTAKDQNAESKRLLLFQYLHDTYSDSKPPPYLKNEFDKYAKRIGERLKSQ